MKRVTACTVDVHSKEKNELSLNVHFCPAVVSEDVVK